MGPLSLDDSLCYAFQFIQIIGCCHVCKWTFDKDNIICLCSATCNSRPFALSWTSTSCQQRSIVIILFIQAQTQNKRCWNDHLLHLHKSGQFNLFSRPRRQHQARSCWQLRWWKNTDHLHWFVKVQHRRGHNHSHYPLTAMNEHHRHSTYIDIDCLSCHSPFSRIRCICSTSNPFHIANNFLGLVVPSHIVIFSLSNPQSFYFLALLTVAIVETPSFSEITDNFCILAVISDPDWGSVLDILCSGTVSRDSSRQSVHIITLTVCIRKAYHSIHRRWFLSSWCSSPDSYCLSRFIWHEFAPSGT
jgi:hypothetical protein